LLSFQAGWAANWAEIVVDANGTIWYLEVDSLYETTSNNILYWVKMVHKNVHNTPGQTFRVNGEKVWYSKVLYGENCSNGLSYAAYQSINYGLQNQILSTNSNNYPMVSRPTPESTGEVIHKVVCGLWALH
jgi:hypothetical protein